MIKKKLFLFFALVCILGINGYSQVNVITISPISPPGIFSFEDLWQMNIILASNSEYNKYYLKLDVYENSKGQVLSSQSNKFPLSKGATYINKANLTMIQPITSTFASNYTYSELVHSGGYFPPGNYTINFRLVGLEPNFVTEIPEAEVAQASYSLKVDFLNPPELIYVFDKDTLKNEKNPMFLWTPPTPLDATANVEYEMKLVEVYSNQTPEQAIYSNPDVLKADRLKETSLVYPGNALPLQDKKNYAWRVTADVNKNIISSEIFRFTYIETPADGTKLLKTDRIYINLNYTPDGSYYCAWDKCIFFKYNEEYQVTPNKLLNYKIFDYQRNLIAGVDKNGQTLISGSPTAHLITGTNYIDMNLDQVTGFDYGHYYFLEVYNDKNETWYLKIFPFASNSKVQQK